MSDSVDLPELRRLAEAAIAERTGGVWIFPHYDFTQFKRAFTPDVVLALLDRIDALEAREVELLNELDDERVAYAERVAADPGAVAGEPESEGATRG